MKSPSSTDSGLISIYRYLNTWRSGCHIFGQSVTYWASAPAVNVPQSMHAYPIIMGSLRQFQRTGDKNWIKYATELGEWYLRDRTPDGAIASGFGDLPGSPMAPVLQAAPCLALLELYEVTDDEKWLWRCQEIVDWLNRHWWDGSNIKSRVVNQSAIFLAVLGKLGKLLHPSYQKQADAIVSWMIDMPYRSHEMKGAFPQSESAPDVLLPYHAKTIIGLSEYLTVQDDPRVIDILQEAIQFLIKRYKKEAYWCGHYSPRCYRGKIYGVGRRISRRATRRLLLGKAASAQWTLFPPFWIARSSICGLAMEYANRVIAGGIDDLIEDICDELISKIDSTGGVPNTIGFRGNLSDYPLWQDVVRPVRWNAYVFWLLSERARVVWEDADGPSSQEYCTREVKGFEGKGEVIETPDLICFRKVFPEDITVNKRVELLDSRYAEEYYLKVN